jgi:hypothetical protein
VKKLATFKRKKTLKTNLENRRKKFGKNGLLACCDNSRYFSWKLVNSQKGSQNGGFSNPWNEFLKKHKGYGLSIKELR